MVPAEPLPLPSEGHVDLSRWRIRESPGSAFEKAGRIIIEGENLVIHIDREPRWFCIPLGDIAAVLAGDSRALLLATGDMVGTARLSASGRAVNFAVGQVLFTTPLARVIDVLEGRARKAAVFAGVERAGKTIHQQFNEKGSSINEILGNGE
jgi:hypothetical protein